MKSEEVGEWKKFTFRLITQAKQVKEDVRSLVEIVSDSWPYVLGEIKLIKDRKAEPIELKCQLEPSKDYLPTTCYYLNLTL